MPRRGRQGTWHPRVERCVDIGRRFSCNTRKPPAEARADRTVGNRVQRRLLSRSPVREGYLTTTASQTGKPQNPLLSRGFTWSGRRDSNPRPSPWQGMSTCFADLRKRPETSSDLHFLLLTGSRRFAVFCDVSWPVSGQQKSGCRDVPLPWSSACPTTRNSLM